MLVLDIWVKIEENLSRVKVLVTNYVHPCLMEGLEQMGYEAIYEPDFDPQELESVLPSLVGIIINTKIKMTAERINLAEKLQFIGRLGSGLDIIDLDAAEQKEVAVLNSPEGNRNAVAEHALGMLLCLANNIRRGDKEVRQKLWQREQNRGFELEGKTVGLIGFGNTGQALARKLSRWALRVTYTDPYLLDIPEEFSNIESVTFNQLQREADIISLHVQLTEETRGMIDKNFLMKCKKGLVLINTSRGAVVDTRALLNSLDSGQVSGACLDVFENEKPHSFSIEENQLYDRLYSLENVVLTPHVAGWTHESLRKIAETLLTKIGALRT